MHGKWALHEVNHCPIVKDANRGGPRWKVTGLFSGQCLLESSQHLFHLITGGLTSRSLLHLIIGYDAAHHIVLHHKCHRDAGSGTEAPYHPAVIG